MRGELGREGEAEVGQRRCAGGRRLDRVGAEDARRARGAVERGLQLTEQVVMFEWRRREEYGIDRHPDERQAPLFSRAMTSVQDDSSLAADQDTEAAGGAAEVRFARFRGHAALADDPADAAVVQIAADADPVVQAVLDAALPAK